MKRLAVSMRVGLVALLALALLVPLAGPASAASIGPDGFGYIGNTTGGSAFEDLNGSLTATAILQNVDDVTAQVPLGITFPFYGVMYTDVFVSSNGLLTFGAGDADFVNTDLMTDFTTIVQPLIAPMWDDWVTLCDAAVPPDFDVVYYETVQTPVPHFVVQWEAVSPFTICSATDWFTFQAALYEDGSIEFRYDDVQAVVANDFGASATVGIRDFPPSGDLPVLVPNILQFSFNTASLSDGQSMRIENICGVTGCGGGGGGGGGGDDGGSNRARTSLTLRGPDAADAGDQITLRGKLRCKKDRCKANAKLVLLRNGQQIDSTRTDGNGRYAFTTNVPASGAATYAVEYNGTKRCRASDASLRVR
ncbi:MAG: hypothetical protein ACXWYI_07745 [Actinomycetota bacterium]